MCRMFSPLVERSIKRKARKNHQSLPGHYRQILSDAVSGYREEGYKVVYSWLWDAGGKVPNASSSIPGVILVNSQWAFLLVMHEGDGVITDAFKMTMGHELTHQENDYFFIEPFTNAGKFVYWVNEVHADYGGIVKAFDGDVLRGIRAMEFKRSCKGIRDKDHRTHPSWKNRIGFISDYDFDRNLIRTIAYMTGCEDMELVNRVCSYYNAITLRRII